MATKNGMPILGAAERRVTKAEARLLAAYFKHPHGLFIRNSMDFGIEVKGQRAEDWTIVLNEAVAELIKFWTEPYIPFGKVKKEKLLKLDTKRLQPTER